MDGHPTKPASPPSIRLDQFLKLMGITTTGGQAKQRIQSGEVKVNGAVEIHRGRTLHLGDQVEVDGRAWTVANLRSPDHG